jgi:hypothetical protein
MNVFSLFIVTEVHSPTQHELWFWFCFFLACFSSPLLCSHGSLVFTWFPKEDPLGSLVPHVANIVVGVIDFYHKFVSLDNKATMSSLEEVRMVQANKEDEEVEQVGGIIPNLGCTRTKNSKYYKTSEFYWHDEEVEQVGSIIPNLGFTRTKNSKFDTRTKNYKFYRMPEVYWHTNTTMVTLGMLQKDQDFKHLKKRMESLKCRTTCSWKWCLGWPNTMEDSSHLFQVVTCTLSLL